MGSGMTILNLTQNSRDMQISSLHLTRLLAATALYHLPIFPTRLSIDFPLIDQYRRLILETKCVGRMNIRVPHLVFQQLATESYTKSSLLLTEPLLWTDFPYPQDRS